MTNGYDLSGLEDHLILGLLYTIPLDDGPNGIGRFEQRVTINEQKFLNSGEKLGLFNRTVGQFLAVAMKTTEVPLEYWRFQCFDPFQRELNLPSLISFDIRRIN